MHKLRIKVIRPRSRRSVKRYLPTPKQNFKNKALQYAEIMGDTLILHIKTMTAETFQTDFDQYAAFPQVIPTMKDAGIATITYTNDANLTFVYNVNTGQLTPTV